MRAQLGLRRRGVGRPEREDWERVIAGIERAIAVTERALEEAVTALAADDGAGINSTVTVRSLVESAARAALEGWGGRLEVAVAAELVAGMHPVDLERVLVNLLTNARRAAGESGRIEVRGERAAGAVSIRVLDDGPGFDPAVLAQVDRGRVEGAAGHGLGLGVCRRLVGAVGGSLRLGAGPSGSAEVEVVLPAARG